MRSYHYPFLKKSSVRKGLTLWIAFTPITFSRYISTLNENTNDMYPSLIEELNRKDRLNI